MSTNHRSSAASSTSSGLSASSVLTIAFVVLKLTHVISWSRWWVLSPLWISTGAVLAFLAVLLMTAIISAMGGK